MDEKIRKGLSKVLKFAGKNPILVEARKGRLFVGAKNDFNSVVFETSSELNEDFRFELNADVVSNTVSMMIGDFFIGDGFIEFKSGSNKTKIAASSMNNNATLSLMRLASGYEKTKVAVFDGSIFSSVFSYAKHASNDKTIGDVVLRGAHFSLKDDYAEVMTSNGYIMSTAKIRRLKSQEDANSSIMILNEEFFNTIKLFSDEKVYLGFNDRAVTLESEIEDYKIRVITSLVATQNNSSYPYERVIETTESSAKHRYSLDKKELLNFVKELKFFCSDNKIHLNIFNTGEMELFVSGTSGSGVRALSYTDNENPSENNLDIKFNVEYLYNYLANLSSQTLILKVNDDKSPVLFEDDLGKTILAPLLK